MIKGTLYGVGVGPGDGELITLKAHRLITSAKIIAYPAPDSGTSFARSIVADYLSPDQIEIPMVVPMRVERFPAKNVYDQASRQIASYLDSGEDVVVLCEGDPFFYGSFMYLYERLIDDYKVDIVPGVSSIMAGAAALGRPLAARNDRLAIIPAPLDDAAIRAQLVHADAAVIMKIGRHFERIYNLLDAEGLMSSAGYLERVTLDNEKIMPLYAAKGATAPYFSLILIYKGAEDWAKLTPAILP